MGKREDDPRYDRTEEDLQEAFQILARRKDLDKITVAEITRLAGVTRSTFYNHYEDMPSLIDAMENRILDEIFTMMRDFHPKGSGEISRKFFEALCGYISQNGFLIHILASPQAAPFIEKALSMFHSYVSFTLAETEQPAAKQQALSYAVSYSIGGVVGVLHKWALEGCRDDPSAAASYLTALFLDGMRPFLC